MGAREASTGAGTGGPGRAALRDGRREAARREGQEAAARGVRRKLLPPARPARPARAALDPLGCWAPPPGAAPGAGGEERVPPGGPGARLALTCRASPDSPDRPPAAPSRPVSARGFRRC
ncbi:translation initiation factor IF-2 [Odocoileus virginianus]|uniref:Translation initiation factor IF-2 n=1 Tax=Odocoileus virginianus TaxID=9874 RepID=A0ABM4IHI8_ODOVR